MASTPVSLLERLRVASPDATDWHRLHEIYLPMIRRWLARVPGLGDDSQDLAQEVLVVVFKELADFERQREGSFRAWLRKVTINRTRNYWKQLRRRPNPAGGTAADDFLTQFEDPAGALAQEWDQEHDQLVLQKLLDVVKPDFSSQVWEGFQRFAIDGLPAARVAAQLGVTENAVLPAKSRIMKRLREEAAGLID